MPYDFSSVLIDLEWEGQPRRALVHPERNGYVYLMVRLTGEILYARPYAHITTSTGVDLETGRLIHNPEKQEQIGRVTREICPASPAAKDWQPSAYSPRTGLPYIPHNNLCQDAEPAQTSYIAGTPYVGMEVRMYAGPGGHRGELTAWDVAAGREVWTIEESSRRGAAPP